MVHIQRPADLAREISDPAECPYLPAETSRMEYRVLRDLNADTFAHLLRRGWRRFGRMVFRPQCQSCRKCRPLRVDVARFERSRSLRRTMSRNAHIHVRIAPPSVTNSHIVLFNTWQADMSERRGWPLQHTSEEGYYANFLDGDTSFIREFQYLDGNRLVGIGLVDCTPIGLSSIYFYHDPAWRPLGPGTYSVLTEIETARQSGLPHVYLGYWIAENQSMRYKSRFVPHELLEDFVEDDVEPVWRPPDEESGGENPLVNLDPRVT